MEWWVYYLFFCLCVILTTIILLTISERNSERKIRAILKETLWDALINDCDKVEYIGDNVWKYGHYKIYYFKEGVGFFYNEQIVMSTNRKDVKDMLFEKKV